MEAVYAVTAVEAVKAVYVAVLPPSLMVFFTSELDLFIQVQWKWEWQGADPRESDEKAVQCHFLWTLGPARNFGTGKPRSLLSQLYFLTGVPRFKSFGEVSISSQ